MSNCSVHPHPQLKLPSLMLFVASGQGCVCCCLPPTSWGTSKKRRLFISPVKCSQKSLHILKDIHLSGKWPRGRSWKSYWHTENLTSVQALFPSNMQGKCTARKTGEQLQPILEKILPWKTSLWKPPVGAPSVCLLVNGDSLGRLLQGNQQPRTSEVSPCLEAEPPMC